MPEFSTFTNFTDDEAEALAQPFWSVRRKPNTIEELAGDMAALRRALETRERRLGGCLDA